MKYKVGDKVKVVKCDSHIGCRNIGVISKIEQVYEFSSDMPYKLNDVDEWFDEDELELVKDEEMLEDIEEKESIFDILKKSYKDVIDIIMQNPEIIIEQFNRSLGEKDKEIEELKREIKELKSENTYLTGKVDAFIEMFHVKH